MFNPNRKLLIIHFFIVFYIWQEPVSKTPMKYLLLRLTYPVAYAVAAVVLLILIVFIIINSIFSKSKSSQPEAIQSGTKYRHRLSVPDWNLN